MQRSRTMRSVWTWSESLTLAFPHPGGADRRDRGRRSWASACSRRSPVRREFWRLFPLAHSVCGLRRLPRRHGASVLRGARLAHRDGAGRHGKPHANHVRRRALLAGVPVHPAAADDAAVPWPRSRGYGQRSKFCSPPRCATGRSCSASTSPAWRSTACCGCRPWPTCPPCSEAKSADLSAGMDGAYSILTFLGGLVAGAAARCSACSCCWSALGTAFRLRWPPCCFLVRRRRLPAIVNMAGCTTMTIRFIFWRSRVTHGPLSWCWRPTCSMFLAGAMFLAMGLLVSSLVR